MRKILGFFSSRMFVTGVIIFFQLLLFLAFWNWLTEYSVAVSLFMGILSFLIVVYIVSMDQPSSYKIGWIILIMLLPILGGMLYLFFGNKRPARRLRNSIGKYHDLFTKYMLTKETSELPFGASEGRALGSINYLQKTLGYPSSINSSTKYYPVGELMFQDMLEELKNAEKFIFMEYFIIEEGQMWDSILEILKSKAKNGVEIRLMYDDMGCLNLLPKNYWKTMESAGIHCAAFNPFVPLLSLAMNHRDHRKILVVDGRVGFTGGINIADEYINVKKVHGHWKDTGIKLAGAAVNNLTIMFLENWNAFRNQDLEIDQYLSLENDLTNGIKKNAGVVVPYGDSPLDNEMVGQTVYIDIINQAQDYVYIFTPYLIIDNEMINSLVMAAKRGVDVRIVTPGVPDKKIIYRVTRSYYTQLLLNGIKVYEYSPGFLHAKSYVSDDKIAVVGTINMDYRSLFLHFECGVFLYNDPSVMDIRDDFSSTLNTCRPISLEQCRQGKLWNLFDQLIKVFAPLM